MVMDSREFAIRVITNSDKYAERLREQALDQITEIARVDLVRVLRSRVWSEFTLGVYRPAKQILLLPEEDIDLKWILTEHLEDEYRHSKTATSPTMSRLPGRKRFSKPPCSMTTRLISRPPFR